MFTNQVDAISNKATWLSQVYELVDEDDDTTTDLTTITALDIIVTIKDSCGTVLATASYSNSGASNNGKVTVPGPGFQWQFEVSDLSSLCAGTYTLGAKITMNSFVTDLIIGTISVLEGN